MPRVTRDAWDDARQRWESDPKQTFESIGKALGVSHTAVRKQSIKAGWQRPTTLREIAHRAQLQADAKTAAKVSEVSGGETKSSFDAAVDVRADLLERHRADWSEHRKLFTLDGIKSDFETGKSAKISAEMLAIRQKGERAAYGLDEEGGKEQGGFDAFVSAVAEELNGRQ